MAKRLEAADLDAITAAAVETLRTRLIRTHGEAGTRAGWHGRFAANRIGAHRVDDATGIMVEPADARQVITRYLPLPHGSERSPDCRSSGGRGRRASRRGSSR